MASAREASAPFPLEAPSSATTPTESRTDAPPSSKSGCSGGGEAAIETGELPALLRADTIGIEGRISGGAKTTYGAIPGRSGAVCKHVRHVGSEFLSLASLAAATRGPHPKDSTGEWESTTREDGGTRFNTIRRKASPRWRTARALECESKLVASAMQATKEHERLGSYSRGSYPRVNDKRDCAKVAFCCALSNAIRACTPPSTLVCTEFAIAATNCPESEAVVSA